MSKSWFEIDREGLAVLLERRGKAWAVLELIQNAFDEPGVSSVSVRLDPVPRSPLVEVLVIDDAPGGFSKISDAWTLFAPSKKRENPELRGRFNIGDKLFLALASQASITTTCGQVSFGPNGRRMSKKERTSAGSVVAATLRMTREELEEALASASAVMVPPSIRLSVNGREVPRRQRIAGHPCLHLPTEVFENGVLRRRERMTEVDFYEPLEGREPRLHELGLPICEVGHGFRWDIDIRQRIPLDIERANVPESYRRPIFGEALNVLREQLTQADATAAWAKAGLGSWYVEEAAAKRVVELRYGEQAATADPSDPEAEKRLVSKGFAIVHGGSMSAEEWEQVRRFSALQPAGQLSPSPKAFFGSGPNAAPLVPEEEWTAGMRATAERTQAIARLTIGRHVHVQFNYAKNTMTAAYGQGTLAFNASLGAAWFEPANQIEIDATIFHELAHEEHSDHLHAGFADEIARIAATWVQMLEAQRSSLASSLRAPASLGEEVPF